MDYENDMVRLGGLIADATDCVRQASQIATRVLCDDGRDDETGWPALAELVDQLDTVLKTLQTLPGEEIADAINKADEYLDHMSDLADGASY